MYVWLLYSGRCSILEKVLSFVVFWLQLLSLGLSEKIDFYYYSLKSTDILLFIWLSIYVISNTGTISIYAFGYSALKTITFLGYAVVINSTSSMIISHRLLILYLSSTSLFFYDRNVDTIGDNAFDFCNDLQTVTFGG